MGELNPWRSVLPALCSEGFAFTAEETTFRVRSRHSDWC